VRIRVPADVDMADRIFAGLTARQLAILGAHGLVLLALYAALGERLPLALLAVMAIPVCLLGLLWATTSPQGTTWEQLGFAAIRHFAKPRRRVLAPEAIPESPAWVRESGALAPLEFPANSSSTDGHVDLGGDGGTRRERNALDLVQRRATFLDGVDDPRLTPVPAQDTGVSGLAAAPSVEDRSIEDDAPVRDLLDGRLTRTHVGVGGT